MKKLIAIALAVAFSAALAGCTVDKAAEPPSPSHVTRDTEADEVAKPLIAAKSLTIESLGSGYHTPYTDQNEIGLFMQAIHTAERITGILNVGEQDYRLHIEDTDGKKYTYTLWLRDNSEQAMLMDMQDTRTGYTVSKQLTEQLKQVMFTEPEITELNFRTEPGPGGELLAVPEGLRKDQYMLSGGPSLKLQGKAYVSTHLFYGNHNAINAIVALDPSTDRAEVVWSEKLTDSNNRWNNAFMNSYTLLFPLGEHQLVFLEPELTEDAGEYHLSAYDIRTGEIKRLREAFWPLTDDYDYIYKFNWKADEQKLFMQSYLGNVWLFDLKTGDDEIHLLKYRVIPHSTTGAPSLFLSPSFKRFVHDDESGDLTFYTSSGKKLRSIALPEEDYVPSQKIKWNPAGTVAWMEQSEDSQGRILDIDIDYLRIAPRELHFYDPDGQSLGSLAAPDDENAALEVAGWMDENVAVIKSYTMQGRPDESPESRVRDEAYYLYNVSSKQSGDPLTAMPLEAAPVTDPWDKVVLPEEAAVVADGEIRFPAK
ncbi:hypothetical protein J41TS12_37490 [Paenibacillus antibioticophila]|uniref:YhfM-like domain-containing protein n=1 Tax=Paenibacillus antibioticophila TaxID=1274374 RepID=A0A919XWF2_9BACL|nr:hypothetical protein [Paenibacillus antibioticophila]GIO38888.1 hypothetical protein J41TS12_37490 [Paenibacillus antibioticophila]